MPKTGENQQNSVLKRDVWTLILRNLTARQQTPLRRVSKTLRGWVNDTDKALAFTSGYGRLLANFKSPLGNAGPADARMLSYEWQKHFRAKLKPTEVDFFTAVICGDVLAVERLLSENNKLIFFCDVFGNTALHFAAIQGDVAMLDCLYAYVPSHIEYVIDIVSRGPNFGEMGHLLNVKNGLNDTPLITAIRSGKREAVEWFRQKLQANVTALQPQAGIAMGLEVQIMDEQLTHLPQHIARLHQNHLLEVVGEADITVANQAQDTLLHEAASSGNVALLKRFLANPAYDNQFLRRTNTAGRNVFHCALQSGHLATVNLLLEKDEALLDTIDLLGQTALNYAIQSRNLTIVKEIARRRPALLQQRYANRQQEINRSLINEAIKVSSVEILQFLIEKDVVLLLDKNSSLALAIRLIGHIDGPSSNKELTAIVRYLINHFYQGVQQGKYTQAAVDNHYSDALRNADSKNVKDIITLLIDAGAIPDFESHFNAVRSVTLSGQRIPPSPEFEKARQDYKDKLYYSRWWRGLLWLSCILLAGAVGVGATALITLVAMPLALNITVQVVASLVMLALAAMSVMTVFKLFDDTWNFPFFSRVRLKPFAPIPSAEEVAAKAKVYYPATTEAKAPAVSAQAPSQNPGIEPIQSEGEAAMPRLQA